MGVTAHQEERIEQALEILATNNRLRIIGSAGVGKTYTVDELLKRLLPQLSKYKQVICAAPTHKALAELKKKITLDNTNLFFSTIHSILQIGPVTNQETGEKEFKPRFNPRYPPLQGVSLLVIDESSMIPFDMHLWIEEFATKFRVKVIFIGDAKQLNPIGEDISTIFKGKPIKFDTQEEAIAHSLDNQSNIGELHIKDGYFYSFEDYPEIELTEIIRQGAGNPIIHLSRNISSIWQYEAKRTEEGYGFVYTYDRNKIINELAVVNGTDELKYLAWGNPEIDSINSEVRQLIYGINPKKVELGETLIFDEPYNEYFTNQEIKVNDLVIEDISFKVMVKQEQNGRFEMNDVTLKCYIINGKKVDEWGDGNLKWKGVFIIHEEAEKQFAALYKFLTIQCSKGLLKWDSRNSFMSKFAKIKYNHALTIHKAQGSTYKQVILNVKNINYNQNISEKQRLFYTGITRASDLLILYDVNEQG